MPGIKRVLLGNPLHNTEAAHQRLNKVTALAVLSSDAMSSVAYGPQEILLVLALAGAASLRLAWPIALAIGVLLVVVVLSYRQTIREYPGGGGSYIVAAHNLGMFPGLVAGASLLVDYILTVAVSISAAVAAITSAAPALLRYTVPMAVFFVVLLAIANLRGVKESGALFAPPTYAFIFLLGYLVAMGLWRFASGNPFTVPAPAHPIEAVQSLTFFLVLKAFASGCSAMTGVEAIANGVQLFKKPEWKNAQITMAWMGGILLSLMLGVALLAVLAHAQPSETETLISQLSRAMFGTGGLYYAISASVALILVLAANTAYADFPRLSSFIAEDDFLPHQLKDRGYRLVFSNGILLLTAAAIALLVVFSGQTTRLIPLYAIGVFMSFTLSQAGMVVHHTRTMEPRWKLSLAINAFGALCTGIVTIIVSVAKFHDGAWIVVLLIPAIMAYFLWVKRQYEQVADSLQLSPDDVMDLNWQSFSRMHNHVVVLVNGLDRRLIRALQYARSLRADDIEAVWVDISGKGAQIKAEWDAMQLGVRLRVIDSPYREIVGPIMAHVRGIKRPSRDHVVTVIVPEVVPESIPDNILHDQTGLIVRTQLFTEPGVIVTDVPYNLREMQDE